MILLKPSFHIEEGLFGDDALRLIERAGRICYKSEPRGNPKAFVRKRLRQGHESILEHAGFTVRFVVDRGISHELVRHRLASFSQESSRYVDYTGMKSDGHCQFIIPSWFGSEYEGGYWLHWEQDNYRRVWQTKEGEAFYQDVWLMPEDPVRMWLNAMLQAEGHYQALRGAQWTPQQARSVLPNSTKTEIFVTANIREWRLIRKQRTAHAAHPQMREVTIPLLKELRTRTPVLFEDIEGAPE